MFDLLQKKLTNTFLKPYLTWYLKKERTDTVRGFSLLIRPTVFHPKYFFSSTFLFDFVSTLNLSGKQFLELGCGSGLISLLAYRKKALVTTTDINKAAVECTAINFTKNLANKTNYFSVLKSDLFKEIPLTQFDVIVINPPYFFEEISTDEQLAWNCGINGEYFEQLFSGLVQYSHAETQSYMVLADNCEIEKIKNIAKSHLLELDLIVQKKIKWENNFIFKINAI